MTDNYNRILEEIEDLKNRLGRKDEILVVAVTKTVDIDIIKNFIGYGVSDIGENKVQELEKRYADLGDSVNYHLIGHLQTNKVRKVVGLTKLIHSVNSIRLLEEIEKRSVQRDVITDILAEINLSEEENKTGMAERDLMPLIEKMEDMKNVRLRGLMTMAPYTEDEDIIRDVFRKANDLKLKIENAHYNNVSMDYLSMGMSNDYRIAIEEGSNIVRIGSALFGKRNY